MKRTVRTLLLGLLLAVVVIQFFPAQTNVSEEKSSPAGLVKIYNASPPVQRLLAIACYDCHSNHTRYPWYSNIQPVGWWIERHVLHGKAKLNLSAFGDYSAKKRRHKLEEITEAIEEGWMPMSSYQLLHAAAKLSEEDKALLIRFVKEARQLEEKTDDPF